MAGADFTGAIDAVRQRLQGISDVQVQMHSRDDVADNDEIARLLAATNGLVPEFLLHVFAQETRHLEFSWYAPAAVFGEDCRCGCVHLLTPAQVVSHFREQQRQADEARRQRLDAEEGYAALVADWPFWLPVFRFPSGDCICVETRGGLMGAAVFLEHDVMDAGPNLHGLILAKTLSDFVQRWAEILFVDVNDWTVCVDKEGLNARAPVFQLMHERLRHGAAGTSSIRPMPRLSK